MRPQTPLPDGTAEQFARLLKETEDNKAYKPIQVVYLRAESGYTSQTIAQMTGYHPVKKIHAQYLKEGENALFPKSKGGHIVIGEFVSRHFQAPTAVAEARHRALFLRPLEDE